MAILPGDHITIDRRRIEMRVHRELVVTGLQVIVFLAVGAGIEPAVIDAVGLAKLGFIRKADIDHKVVDGAGGGSVSTLRHPESRLAPLFVEPGTDIGPRLEAMGSRICLAHNQFTGFDRFAIGFRVAIPACV